MSRAERVLQVLGELQRRRIATAQELADAVGLSTKSIYRYVQDLHSLGVPLEAEPGVGYRLRGYALPGFITRDEMVALVLGARMVKEWTDADLYFAANSVLEKIAENLPEELRRIVVDLPLVVPWGKYSPPIAVDLRALRRACERRQKARIRYRDEVGQETSRTVRPLAVVINPPFTTLAAWCEERQGYRSFRADRIQRLEVLEERFEVGEGCCLDEFERHQVGTM